MVEALFAPRRLRIAQLAPPFESVPPARYGGTERVIATLTEELVRLGHEVTLFATGDSQTSSSPHSHRTPGTLAQAAGVRGLRAILADHPRAALATDRGV